MNVSDAKPPMMPGQPEAPATPAKPVTPSTPAAPADAQLTPTPPGAQPQPSRFSRVLARKPLPPSPQPESPQPQPGARFFEPQRFTSAALPQPVVAPQQPVAKPQPVTTVAPPTTLQSPRPAIDAPPAEKQTGDVAGDVAPSPAPHAESRTGSRVERRPEFREHPRDRKIAPDTKAEPAPLEPEGVSQSEELPTPGERDTPGPIFTVEEPAPIPQANVPAPEPIPQQLSLQTRTESVEAPRPLYEGRQVRELVQEILVVVHPGGKAEVDITLDSKTFDGLQVRISQEDGKVSIQFATRSDDVSKLLDRNLTNLTQSLQARGVQVANVQVVNPTIAFTPAAPVARSEAGGFERSPSDQGGRGRERGQGGGQRGRR